MVTDYEAVFVALGEYVASKTQHGRGDLLQRMAELAAEHRVPAGELSRLLRLYGVEVERVRSITADNPVEADDFGAGLASVSDAALAGHHRTGEVHDGRRDAGAGERGAGRDGREPAGAAGARG